MKKTFLKTVATALVLALVLSTNVFSFSAFAEEVSQTSEIPEGYIAISSAYGFSKIRDNLSGKYILTEDIDMEDYNWTPIGTADAPFTGVIDGNNKIISNFEITDENVTTAKSIGLFGYTSGASISNVYMQDISVTVKQPYTSVIEVNVGALAGSSNRTTFKNCIVTGNIAVQNIRKGSIGGVAGKLNVCSFLNVTNAADVSISTDTKLSLISVGGIAGEARGGMINQCGNHGNVFASGASYPDEARRVLIGGIAGGTADDTNQIINCYNRGNIGIDFSTPSNSIGGIIGDCWYAENCYNTGEITVPEKFGGFVGAIAGNLWTVTTGVMPSPTIKKCYYINDGLFTSYTCSNPPGEDDFADCQKLTAEEMKTADSFAGFNFEKIWQMEEDGYPVLKQQVSFYDILVEEHIINGETSGVCGKNLNYTFNTYTGYLHIYGTGDMDNYDSLSWIETWLRAPWYYEAEKVKTVVIDEGVTSIGACAFDGCENMTSIDIPQSINKIGWGAFAGCDGLESFSIPDGVEAVETSTFDGCSNLKSVNIPKSVTKIDSEAFYYNPALESITVDSENPNYSSDENGILFNKDKTVLVRYPEGKTDTSYTVPDGVTKLGGFAFQHGNFTEINLPESLKEIGWNAFESCPNLKEIIIPDGVETIGSYAFFGCSKLEEIKLSNSLKKLGDYAFFYCQSLKSIQIPDGITVIEDGLFWSCNALETVILHDNLTEIDGRAFKDSAYFKNAEIRDGYALYNGKYLLDISPEATGKIEIKEGTELIAGHAFTNCKNLTEIVIPDSVKTIGDGAFSSCNSLTSIVIPENVTKIGSNLFDSCENLESVEIAGNTSAIEAYTFYDCVKLTEVKLPETVTVINEAAFRECDSLETIVLPDSVEIIGAQAFGWCKNLSEITLPSSLTSIGRDAFTGTKLEALHIPQNVNFIDELAFSGITTVKSITVDENSDYFTSIDNKVLVSKDMTKVVLYASKGEGTIFIIPDTVTAIDIDAFSYSENLERITVPDSVTEFGSFMFRDSKSLKSVALGSGITRLGTYFMKGCESLEKLYLSASVEEISYQALYGCTNLKDIYYGGTEEEWSKIKKDTGNSPLSTATIHYNHVHSHNYSGYTEATEDQNGYNLYTCECGHYYAVFDVVSKSDKYDVTATYSPDCFNEEITLDVEAVTDNREPGGIYMVDGKTYVQVSVFSIKALGENGEVVQPNEGQTVKMKIAIPDGFKDKTDMVIYHRFVDGGREQLSTVDGTLTLENGYMIFEVSKFSEFEILAGTADMTVSKLPNKLNYSYKGTLDLNGIRLKLTDIDGSVEYIDDTSKMTVEGFDSSKLGVQTVTVKYEQYSCKFEVEVRYTWWQWIIRILLLGFLWY